MTVLSVRYGFRTVHFNATENYPVSHYHQTCLLISYTTNKFEYVPTVRLFSIIDSVGLSLTDCLPRSLITTASLSGSATNPTHWTFVISPVSSHNPFPRTGFRCSRTVAKFLRSGELRPPASTILLEDGRLPPLLQCRFTRVVQQREGEVVSRSAPPLSGRSIAYRWHPSRLA